MRISIAIVLCATFTSLSCSHNSTEPKEALPDLVILNVTYARMTGNQVGGMADTLSIKNIGQGDFIGLLYVASASEKTYQKDTAFDHINLVYYAPGSGSYTPGRISAGQTMRVFCGLPIPTDTNAVRFHIDTDDKDRKPGSPTLPIYQESNYDNNDFLLTLQF